MSNRKSIFSNLVMFWTSSSILSKNNNVAIVKLLKSSFMAFI